MKLGEMREIVKRELEHISKRARGSPQNELRMIYWTVRTNSLGKDPRFKTKEECLQYAIERIRKPIRISHLYMIKVFSEFSGTKKS